jgi:hypothetical protein
MTDHVIGDNVVQQMSEARKACIAGVRRGRRRQQLPRLPCSCGRCRNCLDDARWERIFQDRFADPDYYRQPRIRLCSPLAGFVGWS